MEKFPDYKTAKVDSLIPYARNSRTHSDAQVDKIAASIKEFGFLNPVIVDGDNGIIAGHGRLLAAKKLGMDQVPTVEASHLTDAQRRAYVIADNRLALDAGWDDEMLRVEFEELEQMGYDLKLTGFDIDEIKSYFDFDPLSDQEFAESNNPYTSKMDAPHYQPMGEKPKLEQVYDNSKALGMIEDIQNSNLPNDEKQFLMAASSRHIVFNFEQSAEYYAHSNAECQKLMEDSALVVVDLNKAIEQGYVKLNDKLADLFDIDSAGENDE